MAETKPPRPGSGHTALVTGASSGIGFELARLLADPAGRADDGIDVTVAGAGWYRSLPDMPEDVRSAIRASLEDLATRVGAAVENAAETGFRPSP